MLEANPQLIQVWVLFFLLSLKLHAIVHLRNIILLLLVPQNIELDQSE